MMIHQVVKSEVPYIYADQALKEISTNSTLYVLDAREKKEFATSHIPGAIPVGYDSFSLENVKNIPKSARIYVYCSIGYRSNKVAEILLSDGYKNVYNLYGGVFNWANNGFPLVNNFNQKTDTVHGYNPVWGIWLNEERCRKVLD